MTVLEKSLGLERWFQKVSGMLREGSLVTGIEDESREVRLPFIIS